MVDINSTQVVTWTSFTLDGDSSFTFTDAGNYDVKVNVTGTGGSDDEIKTNYIIVDYALVYFQENGHYYSAIRARD